MMRRIILVPTSHVAEESLRKIESVLKGERPDAVAVELDPSRLAALVAGGGRPSLRELGPLNYLLFYALKKAQDWLGRKAGLLPGSEMLRAVQLAHQRKIPVYLIDRDIRETLGKLQAIPRREKLGLLWLLVKGFSLSAVSKGEKIDLSKVPPEEVIGQALSFLEKQFPGFYGVLITERDAFMAHQLFHLAQRHKKIVAVVGAGHREGMMRLLKTHPRKGREKAPE